MEKPEQLLTVRDIARRFGRSEETVRRWIWSGRLKATKLGNQLFVDPADLRGMPVKGRAMREVAAPYRTERRAKMSEGKESVRLPVEGAVYDMNEMEALMASARELRERIFRRTGYIDVAEALRESREGH
jgi:excisionase family DNA binding protein